MKNGRAVKAYDEPQDIPELVRDDEVRNPQPLSRQVASRMAADPDQ